MIQYQGNNMKGVYFIMEMKEFLTEEEIEEAFITELQRRSFSNKHVYPSTNITDLVQETREEFIRKLKKRGYINA